MSARDSPGPPDWHAQSSDEVLQRLGVREDGLSAEQAGSAWRRTAPTACRERAGPSAWTLLARQVASPLMYALLASAALAIALGELEDGLVVLAVVVLNALIGFARSSAPGGRSRRSPSWSPSRRGCGATGAGPELPAEEVVPGDLVAARGRATASPPTCACCAATRCARRRRR